MASSVQDIHRIGGASLQNLRLKPKEATLDPPGISVLRADTPEQAAQQMKNAFPKAKSLHEQASLIASTSEEEILAVGFDILHSPSQMFPNHYRITHREGVAGFTDDQLVELGTAFREKRLAT